MDRPPSPVAKRKRNCIDSMKSRDWISNLPDELLLMVLKKISTDEAIKTSLLSKRWKNVWKQMQLLAFDNKKIFNLDMGHLVHRSQDIAEMIHKVINNLSGNLMCFETQYFSCKSKDSTWIRTLIQVKHTHSLKLANPLYRCLEARKLHLLPNTFAHPTLKYLFLNQYKLETARAFHNCTNLQLLILENIYAEIEVFNKVIASCPSLKVLALNITWNCHIGTLKIQNNNLKLLRLRCPFVLNIEVSANLLDIFSVDYIFIIPRKIVTLTTPRLAPFNKLYPVDEMTPHLCYNITCDDKKDIGHGFAVSPHTIFLKRYKSMEVSVDLMNPREVEKLKEVLLAWSAQRNELGIIFKHNNVCEEGETSTGGAPKKKWDKVLNADFRVKVVCMYNFSGSNEEEFALASRFVTQGTVVEKLMIKATPFPNPQTVTAVGKLMQLKKGNKDLSIEYF